LKAEASAYSKRQREIAREVKARKTENRALEKAARGREMAARAAASGPTASAASVKALKARALERDVDSTELRREMDAVGRLPVKDLKAIEKELVGVNLGGTKAQIVGRIERDIGKSIEAGQKIREIRDTPNSGRYAPNLAERLASAKTPTTRGIGGREPDLRNVDPAGPTSASARTQEARREARDRLVRASREAARAKRDVMKKRKKGSS
jgi:hypothetical protein